MAYGDAKRKIFFFRAVADEDTGATWDREAVCAGVDDLTGKDTYFEAYDQVVRAEVFESGAPQGLRFFKVRRDDLPAVDDGTGGQTDLTLAADEGLAEAIHLVLFPNEVIGGEFFFYGPRMTRFERFLRNKLDMPFSVQQMARYEVIDEALAYGEIRLMRVKLNPSATSAEAAESAKLNGLMNVASSFDAGVYVDVTLRSEKNDSGFTGGVKDLLQRVKDGDADIGIFEKLEIEGKADPGSPVTPLDLLSERLYRVVEIPYRTTRYRDLESGAAFSAIRDAYEEVKDDLPKDALG